ncbi:MAG: peptidoglycan DD-metalloendopeptidase family protein [Bacilli bacterium]|nr:peptidoglycan DD-metalloendopeptidase family protein [Bacilli bacterium]
MKNKLLIGTSIILLLVSFVALPVDTSAKTIQEFENEVSKYTKQLEEKKANLARNNEEVQQIIKKIKNIESQIEEAENEIKRLQEEIEASQKEIERKSEESKNIISYYQVSNGENAYLEYAFGAESITDMIYRLSIVEQLTEYNNKIMKELEELIKKNQATQEELKKKEEELKSLKAELKSEQARIEADSASIRESMPSIQEQINSARDSVKYYKSLGCGASEDIQACEYRVSQERGSSLPSVGFFSRPMDYGYLVRGMWGGHMGYDLSSGNKNIAIHPIAAGMIHAIYTDACTTSYWCSSMGYWCNGNAKIVVVKHNYGGRYIYSSYVHLSGYGNIWEGQYVSKDSVIGYMGTTGCSTGEHLHLEIADCHWKNGGCSYNSYTNRLIDPGNLINFPGSWSNR